jgi:hypothetical protein
MLHFITAIIAGIVGIFAALIGIGIGIGALLLAAAPFLILLLIPLLPVLLIVWILRRIGILSGPFLTFLVIVAGLFLMIGGVHSLWDAKSLSVEEWVDAKKQQLEACQEQGGNNVTVEWGDGDLVFTCRGKRKAPSEQPRDAHI